MGEPLPEAVVEAVARAICVACEENPDRQGDARGNEFRWQDYRDTAVAAISAFTAAQGEAKARADRLSEALRELEGREQRDEALLRQALDALAYWLEHGETPGSHDIIQRTHDVLRNRLK